MKKLLNILSLLMIAVCMCCSSVAEGWICATCGHEAIGNYCSLCGERKTVEYWECPSCGNEASGNYCNNCGEARKTEDEVIEENNASNVASPVDVQDMKDSDALNSSSVISDAELISSLVLDGIKIEDDVLDRFNFEFNESKFTGQRLKISYVIKLKEYTKDSPDVIDIVVQLNVYKDESKDVLLTSQEEKISLYKSYQFDAKGSFWIVLPDKYDSGIYWEERIISVSGE